MVQRTVKFEPLSWYGGYETYGSKAAFGKPYTYFWNRQIADDLEYFEVTVSLNGPPTGNEVCQLKLQGDANHNTDYTLSADWNSNFNVDKVVTLNTVSSRTFRVIPVTKSSWFVEKEILISIDRAGVIYPVDVDTPQSLKYVTRNLNIDEDRNECKIVLYSHLEPPILKVFSSDATVANASDTVTVEVSSSQTLLESVSIYYKLEGQLSGSLSGPTEGTVIIPAGDFSGSFDVQYTGGGVVGHDCSVMLDYERNTVLYTRENFDPDSITPYVSGNGLDIYNSAYSEDIHVDQNQQYNTNDLGLVKFESENFDLPFFAATESVNTQGGTPENPAYNGPLNVGFWEFLDQLNSTKHTDPVTGNNLKRFALTERPLGAPYVRESFFNTWCAGPRTNHDARRYVRHSIRIEPLSGTDSSGNSEFISLTSRVRTRNRNHTVGFRLRNLDAGWGSTESSTDFSAIDGTNVSSQTYQYSDGTDIWVWDINNMHPDCSGSDWSGGGWGTWYGAFEDEHGKGIYQVHKIDPDIIYSSDQSSHYRTVNDLSTHMNLTDSNGNNPGTEGNYPELSNREYATGDSHSLVIRGLFGDIVIPNVTRGDEINPIFRPIHSGEVGKMGGINYIRDNDIGTMLHSKSWEMSDTVLSGPPSDFWPNMNTRWSPRGNATRSESIKNHQRIELV